MKPSRSEFIQINDLRYHVRHWGSETAPKLFMLHGWLDVSATFQFLVDSLKHEWHVIAPDWRGFGLTESASGHGYWFQNYVADLDAVLHHYEPDNPVFLLGHSMGGNVATVYAGVMPERIQKLINLEGYGLSSPSPDEVPVRYRTWLDQIREQPDFRNYPAQADVVSLLQKVNPRLTEERAGYLSNYWAEQNEQGDWKIKADPKHRYVSPMLYRAEEALACWREITSPTLWVEAEQTDVWERRGGRLRNRAALLNESEQARQKRVASLQAYRGEFEVRLNAIQKLKKCKVSDAGHMLHHDQPEQVAQLVESFLFE